MSDWSTVTIFADFYNNPVTLPVEIIYFLYSPIQIIMSNKLIPLDMNY